MTTTETTRTYYAVTNVGGPISVELDASTVEEARAAFEELDARQAIDDARTDAEDALGICGEGLASEDFGAALEAAGAEHETHLDRDWSLWSAGEIAPVAIVRYEPANVDVADDRGTVEGARCTVMHPDYDGSTRLDVIPQEGPSPDCWLGHVGVTLDEQIWDALDQAARAGARGRSGMIAVTLDA